MSVVRNRGSRCERRPNLEPIRWRGELAGFPSSRAWLLARYQPQPGLIFAVASSSEPISYAIALLSGEIAPFSRG